MPRGSISRPRMHVDGCRGGVLIAVGQRHVDPARPGTGYNLCNGTAEVYSWCTASAEDYLYMAPREGSIPGETQGLRYRFLSRESGRQVECWPGLGEAVVDLSR